MGRFFIQGRSKKISNIVIVVRPYATKEISTLSSEPDTEMEVRQKCDSKK